RPDLLIGSSPVINWVGRRHNCESWNLTEDDANIIRNYWILSKPFVTKIIKPSSLSFEIDKRAVFHSSYHELAYLHPNNFNPNKKILQKYNLKEKQYAIIRLSALSAYHDVSAIGLTNQLLDGIKNILNEYVIVETIENSKDQMIDPWDIHDILAFSKMLVSDSQTMTIEASVLGIPSVRINSFFGKSSVIEELENKYKLAVGFLPHEEDKILNVVDSILADPQTDKIWAERRSKLLSDKIDFNHWMIKLFNKQIIVNN
ncbi:uncharacterized protein METZ01_LOCUS428081, partial [marine metagenome]